MTPLLKPWFDLGAHDIRSTLPAALQPIVQDGLLDRTFQDALIADMLFPAVASVRPWQQNMGDTATFTRRGLLAPQTDPITGSDAATSTYGVEQWSMTMDQYGHAVDTNLLNSAVALQSKYLEDVQAVGTNAGQSINLIARDKLYAAYAGGRTWVTTTEASDDTVAVDSVDGFTEVLVNGVPTPVSATNPLSITIAGAANTVVGVDETNDILTLGTAVADTAGDPVVADNAPTSFRPGGKDTAFDLVSTDVATFSLFRDAVTRLRNMNVPTVGGAYPAHISPQTENQLFSDQEFQDLYAGAVESPVWRDMSLGRFGGIDWVRNNETPQPNNGTIDYHQDIVHGADAFLAGPMEGMGDLLGDVPEGVAGDVRMIDVGLESSPLQVARIIRAPQDRLQQEISTAWSFVGDFATPSDTESDPSASSARYRRAVVIEHA